AEARRGRVVSALGARALAPFGALCLVLGLAVLAHVLLRPASWLRQQYARHVARLDRQLRLCFLPTHGRRIAALQLALCALAAVAALLLERPWLWLLAALALALPQRWLLRRQRRHVAQIEAQLDTFIVGLANALKVVPSPAAALAHLAPILPLPLRLE